MFHPCKSEWTLWSCMPWGLCTTVLLLLFPRTLLDRILDNGRDNASLKACLTEAVYAPASSRPPEQPPRQLSVFPSSPTELGASSHMQNMPAYVQRGSEATGSKQENLGNLSSSNTKPGNTELYKVKWWNIFFKWYLANIWCRGEIFQEENFPHNLNISRQYLNMFLDVEQSQWTKN